MVNLLEIPNFIYPVVFVGIAVLVIYTVQPPQVNIISAPISNFTNINKTVLYTVTQPDNITISLYKYGSIENLSKKMNLSINEILKRLNHSQTFFLNCTLLKEKKIGDPFITTQNCTVFGRNYEYNP